MIGEDEFVENHVNNDGYEITFCRETGGVIKNKKGVQINFNRRNGSKGK